MSEPTNLYAAPKQGQSRLCDLPPESEITAHLSVPPHHLLLLTSEAAYLAKTPVQMAYRFTREDLAQNTTFVTIRGSGILVTMELDKKQAFSLPLATVNAMEEWLGPRLPDLVQRSVRSRWGWNVGIGLLFIFTGKLNELTALNIGWVVLGFGMVLCGALAKLRPAVWIWWLDGALSALLAALIVADVFRLGASHWRLLIAASLVWTAIGRARLATHVSDHLRRLTTSPPV